MKSEVNHSLPARLRAAFESQLPLPNDLEPHLAGAVGETLRHPGNMIRAELAFRLGRSYDLPENDSESLAIAVEYFHTASLIFDDLPCMDDALLRRGSECVHRAYGEGAAILSALAFINRAYGLLWKAVADVPAEARNASLAYVEQQLGVAGLLNGQSRDLYLEDHGRHAQLYRQIAIGKTASLIRLSLVLPAIMGEASPREICLLERLSVAWGLCYQILDDLKDILHTAEEGGKTAARDAEMLRPNLALAIGMEASLRRAHRLIRMSDRVIAKLALQRGRLAFLADTIERFQAEMRSLSRVPQIASL
ncbi:MAG: polyprenyl synthetase family protein [Acidobacteriaceae bacterium]